MIFDLGTWPLTAWTYEGSHIISINQVFWIHWVQYTDLLVKPWVEKILGETVHVHRALRGPPSASAWLLLLQRVVVSSEQELGDTNKFVYWMKNRIQFYHYYVLRILCPISLYTFLNKQISYKRERERERENKLTYQLWYPKLFSIYITKSWKRNLWGYWHYFNAMEPKNTGNHTEKMVPSIFLNHIIILNFKWQNHGKKPVRVLTPFQCDGTKKHWEPHGERGYYLKNLSSSFLNKKNYF